MISRTRVVNGEAWSMKKHDVFTSMLRLVNLRNTLGFFETWSEILPKVELFNHLFAKVKNTEGAHASYEQALLCREPKSGVLRICIDDFSGRSNLCGIKFERLGIPFARQGNGRLFGRYVRSRPLHFCVFDDSSIAQLLVPRTYVKVSIFVWKRKHLITRFPIVVEGRKVRWLQTIIC